jgi:2-succinyl-5-enolpyruvyl-6-hydroxy-3-cyclohexene-1-carboxylate synthase
MNRYETIINELVRRGITTFILSPGSRCTPLTLAVARHPAATSVVAYDERGGAYRAVGYARATRKPAVLICTSGTAAANYLPAIAEACNDAVPLIAITADRPPELHGIGANQTMDQQNLYGNFVRQFVNLPPEEVDPASSRHLEAVCAAFDRCVAPVPGPVHINCMLREPFAFTTGTLDYPAAVDREGTEQPVAEPAPLDERTLEAVARAAAESACPVIVAGYLPAPDERAAVAGLARKLGWPVWADIRSGLRSDPAFARSRTWFEQRVLRGDQDVDFVLHLGGDFVSKALLTLFRERFSGEYVKIPGSAPHLDPTGQCSTTLAGSIPTLCGTIEGLAKGGPATPAPGADTYEALERQLVDESKPDRQLSEPAVGYLLSKHLSDASGLVIGNSMPIRCCDRFAIQGHLPQDIACNRGVSGIDGTIATAIGYGAGLGKPVVCLLGDLSFMHDMNSLSQLESLPSQLVLAVINNRGGGIFHHLPIAGQTDVFKPFFETPHGYTFESTARQFGIDYVAAATNGEFVEALQAMLRNGGRHGVIELSVDQAFNMQVYGRLDVGN